MDSESKRERVLSLIESRGYLRPQDLDQEGISRVYLNKLFEEGAIDRPGRGLYTSKNLVVDENQALVEASIRVARGVVCLLSALRFHGLTTQAPFEVWLAIGGKAHRPKIDYPPIRVCRFSDRCLDFGVVEHEISGVMVQVFSPAKTVADCFKYRNKVGVDVAIEALREVWSEKLASMDEILEAAKVCRVANVIRPYLESLA